MTRDATIARTARRQVTREGIDIDIERVTASTETEHGERPDSTTTETVQAIVPTPNRSRDASFFGVADTDLDIQFIMDSTVDVDGGGANLASKIDMNQDGTFEYVVLTAVDTQNGLQRVACTERDTIG